MSVADYLRQQASELHDLATREPDPALAAKLRELAERCRKLANEMGTNGHSRPQG